jgi:D-alanyl-D-alanine dipeptidase
LSVARRLVGLTIVLALGGCTGRGSPRTSVTPTPPTSTESAAPSSSSVVVAPTTGSSSSTAPPPTSSGPPPVPPVSAQAQAAGLIDIRTVVPDALIDLRYATPDNFTGVVLYPADARCLVHESMAAGLATAAARLRAQGNLLVFWDCYRPHSVQVKMFQIVPDPNWVARPGAYATSHESARSVDVTLARANTDVACPSAVQGHCLLDMGTGFDDFTARAHAFATTDVSATAQADRATLRVAMNAGGITVYSGEWWHFDGPGSAVKRPQLDVPVD